MNIVVDASQVQRAAAQLNGAGAKVRQAQAKAATRVVNDIVTFIKHEYRSGPTTDATTQARSNKLRNSYTSKVDVEPSQIVAKAGLIQGQVDGSVLGYGRLQEGLNPDGSTFTEKKIRAKDGSYLHFPIYRSNFAGTAKSNIRGWVRTKEVTFRPRPSFPAAEAKYRPQMEAAVGDAAVTVLAEVGR